MGCFTDNNNQLRVKNKLDMKKRFKNTKPNGYIALASMIVIASVVIVIGVSVSLTAISESQTTLAQVKSDSSLDLVDSCVEDALLYLNENNSVPATISLPQGSCSILVNSSGGGTFDFTVTGSFENYTKKARIVANRTSTLSITSWNETL